MVTEELIRKAIRRGHWNVMPLVLLLVTHGLGNRYPILSWQANLADWAEWIIILGWVARLFYVRRHPLVSGVQESVLSTRAFAMGWAVVAVVLLGGWFSTHAGYF